MASGPTKTDLANRDDERYLVEDESENEDDRRNKRQKEWGYQFDMWLIRASRKKQLIELFYTESYAGVTRDENIITCIPLRVDKYMIEVMVDGREVWLNKMLIGGCKQAK